MNTQRLTDMTVLIRQIPNMFRIARQGALVALTQTPADSSNPLGAVPQPAAAEGQGTQPDRVIPGSSPSAVPHPRRVVSRPDGLRELAVRARQAMADPFGPHGVLPDWSDCVDWAPLSATGEYCAAVGPDVVIELLDERDRYRDALTVIADNPCATPAGPMGCDERFGRDGGEWCMSCLARAGLDAQVWG